LVGLYEEGDKPNNSIDYLKKNLGAPVEVDTVKLKAELEKTKEENLKLRKELEQYRKEVWMLKFSSTISTKKTEIDDSDWDLRSLS
jgi:regulator of replication initiation timing